MFQKMEKGAKDEVHVDCLGDDQTDTGWYCILYSPMHEM